MCARRSRLAASRTCCLRSRLFYLAWQGWLSVAAPGKIAAGFEHGGGEGQHTGDAAVPAGAVPCPACSRRTDGSPERKTIPSKFVVSNERTWALVARPYWVTRVEPLPPGG